MQINQVITMPVTADPTLHGIISDLISDAASLAVQNHNYIINNVPYDLQVEANGSIISSVLTKLFNTTIRHTQNSVILVSARAYGHVILIQLKSKGNISPALPIDISDACIKAQKTGGVIELTLYENEQASIAYCFLNVAGEA